MKNKVVKLLCNLADMVIINHNDINELSVKLDHLDQRLNEVATSLNDKLLHIDQHLHQQSCRSSK